MRDVNPKAKVEEEEGGKEEKEHVESTQINKQSFVRQIIVEV